NPFVNSVFDNLFNVSFITDLMVTRVPAVKITVTTEAYHIELAAPGLKKTDFQINVDKNIIYISADKKEETEVNEKTYSNKEYSYKTFSISITFPDTVDHEDSDAEYIDGVLNVKIGKKEEAIVVKRLIEVK